MRDMLLNRGFIFLPPLLFASLVLGGGTATAVVSQNALPGDLLYSVKEITESARVSLTPDNGKANLYLKLAEGKLQEIEKLEEKGESLDKINQANERFQKYQKKVADLVGTPATQNITKDEIVQKLEKGTRKQKQVLDKVAKNSGNQVSNERAKVTEDTKKESERVTQQVSQGSTTGSNNSNFYPTPYQTPPSASSPVLTPSPLPGASVLPTLSPTPGATPIFTTTPTIQKAILEVFAKDRAELPSNDLYMGIVRVKHPISGVVVASGEMTTPGYLRLENITAGTYDVVLLKPTSFNSDTCGQKVSVTLDVGETERVYMRLSGIAVSGYPCVRN